MKCRYRKGRLAVCACPAQLSGDIGQIEIPQRSSAVLSYPLFGAREALGSETPRVHHAARRRDGCGPRQSFCDELSHRWPEHSHLQGACKHQADHDEGAGEHTNRDQSACALALHNKRRCMSCTARPPTKGESPRSPGWAQASPSEAPPEVSG